MRTSIVINVENEGLLDAAEAFSSKSEIPISKKPGDELTLVYGESGVSLCGFGLCYQGNFENMLRRVTKGRLSHELLVHAAKHSKESPLAIDATAGMGDDSFLLAACGYKVTLYEQNLVIAELLRDAISRAKSTPELEPIVNRMSVIEGNSIVLMPQQVENPDVIYLDPMFPARKKSGLINKKLQLIQKLEAPCPAEADLFDAAVLSNPHKIIVKRPLKGPYLADKKPSYTLSGKAIRFDCYIF